MNKIKRSYSQQNIITTNNEFGGKIFNNSSEWKYFKEIQSTDILVNIKGIRFVWRQYRENSEILAHNTTKFLRI